MWNQRFESDDFVYGTEANSFLEQNAKILIGPVLSIAEGEGRNAVFLASLGLEVLGVDGSSVGLAKAQKLAASRGLMIPDRSRRSRDLCATRELFWLCHFYLGASPESDSKRLHNLVERCLKPGGIILLEAYTKAQLNRDTGGPKNPDMLMSKVNIEVRLNCKPIVSQEIEREVIEGKFHTGLASVVQFIARKKEILINHDVRIFTWPTISSGPKKLEVISSNCSSALFLALMVLMAS